MRSRERIDKIADEVKLKNFADEFYKVGCVVSLSTIRYFIEKEYPSKDIIEYIESTINGLSDDLKLLYIESLIELKETK